jgi:hypothetical protein
MKRIVVCAVLATGSTVLPAGAASGQAVQVGSVSTDRLCLIARSSIYLEQPTPWQPGDPISAESQPPPPTGRCATPPIRLSRARRMTVTVEAERITAAWFQGGAPTPIGVRAAGPKTWLLTLPLATGRLVLSVWSIPSWLPGPRFGVVQNRQDYKLSIRRTKRTPVSAEPPAKASPPEVSPTDDLASEPPTVEPQKVTTFDGSG